MEHFIEDNDRLFDLAFIKIAGTSMDSQIPVPNGVAEVAKDAYDNRFSKDVNFGDGDYSSDDVVDITLKLRYDWAEYESATTAGAFAAVYPKA